MDASSPKPQPSVREADPIQVGVVVQRIDAFGFNAVSTNSTFYIGTVVSFIIASFVPGLSRLPFPVIGCMINDISTWFGHWDSAHVILVVLYSGHFVRRTLEVFLVHRYKRKMPLGETLGAPVYYWCFGFWAGWSLRPDLGYINTYLPLYLIGCATFLVGEVGNCVAHIQLRQLRHVKQDNTHEAPPSGHAIPRGLLFSLVSCPHYTFEIVTWTGFFLATWTLNGALFLAATLITLVVYSRKHHHRYKDEFNGRDGRELYPENRKALIPFLF
ncbi:very-long-chain enoyl-CoA reductase-like [Asterias rubens]|uniref:very-long-chain enoyl-CoA reductase-like n=1 Tax=Asterias rubens TaxID=7604 RepID=UPI00145596A8|nr:very-long-chain enoyl-CoA reductase-like [Asterias rubens]